MKIKVSRRIAPTGNQHRYRLTCHPHSQFNASGDVLPDLLNELPSWFYHSVDQAFRHIRDARPWSVHDKSITITIEIK